MNFKRRSKRAGGKKKWRHYETKSTRARNRQVLEGGNHKSSRSMRWGHRPEQPTLDGD